MTSPEISSKDWRIKKSTIAPVEIAQGLNALRKTIGSISPNTEQVSFGKEGENSYNVEGKQIIIDSRFALESGQFPIPDKDFDVLVGLAVHEAAHSIVDSDALPKTLSPYSNIFNPTHYIQTAEEIYVDGYIARHNPIQYQYLHKARLAYDKPGLVTWDSFSSVWTATEIYPEPRDMDKIPKWQHAVYVLLDALTSDLRTQDWPVELRGQRLQKYWDLIYKLLQVESTRAEVSKIELTGQQLPPELVEEFTADPRELTPPDPTQEPSESEKSGSIEEGTGKPNETEQDPDGEDIEPELTQEEGVKTEDNLEDTEPILFPESSPNRNSEDEHNIPRSLPQALQEQVDQAIESGTEDLTSELQQILDEAPEVRQSMKDILRESEEKAPTIFESGVSKELAGIPDPKLVKDITWIRDIKNTIARQVNRGQSRGTLDRRRLKRHYIDGKVFKTTKIYPRQQHKLQLLVDASGSMSANEYIYEACYALIKVIPEAELLSYANPLESHGTTVTHVNAKGIIRKIQTTGGTPTGRAMIVASMKHPNSLLIHFTDGQANRDIDPIEALTHIIAKRFPKVQVANIILNAHTPRMRHKLEEYWAPRGLNWTTEFIASIQEFPDALRRALKPWYQT